MEKAAQTIVKNTDSSEKHSLQSLMRRTATFAAGTAVFVSINACQNGDGLSIVDKEFKQGQTVISDSATGESAWVWGLYPNSIVLEVLKPIKKDSKLVEIPEGEEKSIVIGGLEYSVKNMIVYEKEDDPVVLVSWIKVSK